MARLLNQRYQKYGAARKHLGKSLELQVISAIRQTTTSILLCVWLVALESQNNYI